MIKVMTDNAANLPPELRAQYAITELCLTYTIDGEPVDISKPFDGHAFYEAMRKGAEVKTSMITPLAAREAMEPVLDRGDDVLYVGLSGGVSGTCWGVSVVAQELRGATPTVTYACWIAAALPWARGSSCWKPPIWRRRAQIWRRSWPAPTSLSARCASTSWWTI